MASLSFFRSALIALALSAAASVIYLSATTFFGTDLAIRLTISAVTFGYILYLLGKADVAFGKISFISVYLVSIAAFLYLWPDIVVYALCHVGFIWLVRTVYYHSNFFYALADLVLSVVGFGAALGAVMQSHSVFMSFWSFFLAQALILPALHYFFSKRQPKGSSMAAQNQRSQPRFHQAHRSAQEALRKLANNA